MDDELSGVPIREYQNQLFKLAKLCQSAPDVKVKKSLTAKFLLMCEHFLDQGWKEGSGLGAQHHLGYKTREFGPAVLLMEKDLKKAGLLPAMVYSMLWMGRDFLDFTEAISKQKTKLQKAFHRRTADYLNTFLKTHFYSLLLLENNQAQLKALLNFSQTMADTTLLENGIIKNDGALHHHGMHYFGYGMPALEAFISLVSQMDGSVFEISQAAYERLKMAVLKAEIWAFPYSGPIATGRHPLFSDATGQLPPLTKMLSLSAPGTDKVDYELSQSYQRMQGQKNSSAINGYWNLNTAAAGLYKFNEFSVQMKGYSHVARSHETYKKDNRFGRYLGSGSVFVFDSTTSGYNTNGWDWTHIPGTTSLKLPLNVLEGNAKAFYGWKPRQKAEFSGSGNLGREVGMFVFQNGTTKDQQSIGINQSILTVGDKMICLGSNLTSKSSAYPLVTTIFQRGISSLQQSLVSSNEQVSAENSYRFNFKLEKDFWIIDAYGVGYFLPKNSKQSIHLEKQMQYSLHDKTKAETQGLFAKMFYSFGKKVGGQNYQYVMLLDADEVKMKSYAQAKPFYKVLRQDSKAHVISVAAKKLKAYAIFTDGKCHVNDQLIKSSDGHLIILAKQINDQTIQLSVTHPLIHKRGVLEKAKTQKFTVSLNGSYKLKTASDSCGSLPGSEQSNLHLSLIDGGTLELTLIKK
ncbi:MAG: hypothetical protein HRT88_17050 [Lentisphaeraceae bacterium]|nr:hypothetical protein [Lentisphaeraceae bacterium]